MIRLDDPGLLRGCRACFGALNSGFPHMRQHTYKYHNSVSFCIILITHFAVYSIVHNMSLLGFEIIPLTPDEDDSSYNHASDEPSEENTVHCNWIDDNECVENLFQIVPLMPEESCIDENNHIQTHIKLFFEELGYLTEEPEPIDPTRDYDAEARQMLEERARTRQKHIQLSRSPSLCYSGISSISSSHNDYQHLHDVRSPLYMGQIGRQQQHHHTAHVSSSSSSSSSNNAASHYISLSSSPSQPYSHNQSSSRLPSSCVQAHLQHHLHRPPQHIPHV